MDRLEDVATPPTAATVVVPASVRPPRLLPLGSAVLAVEPLTVFPNGSCTPTSTARLITAPAVALVGCTVKASLEAAAGVMLNADEVAPVRAAEVALSV